jgi:hypothetical protein
VKSLSKTCHSLNPKDIKSFTKSNTKKATSVAFLLTITFEYAILELININKHMNKYTKWYNSITNTAKSRVLDCYTETHHIKPRSLGGNDDLENIVELTAREHFICHWLLVKMTTGKDHHKMLNALRMMRAENPNQQRYKTMITARVYENIKIEYAKLQSKKFTGKGNGFYGKSHTEEARKRISEANKGRVQPADEKEKQKAAWAKRRELGIERAPISEEARAKFRKINGGKNNPRYGVSVSEETRAKQREKAIGRKQSEETKQKKADAIRGLKREKLLCPHCDQLVAVNGYARWHGTNCKLKSRNPINTLSN